MCGIASVYLIAGEAEIMNIAVLPEYRRNGVADALMNKIFSLSRENGCTVATLEVADGNIGAVALYEKHGFKISGRRIGFYKGVDALNMEKKL
jgi:ribosomal-protein-alanine N-acetyltransferase